MSALQRQNDILNTRLENTTTHIRSNYRPASRQEKKPLWSGGYR